MISRRKGVSPFGEVRAIMKIAIALVLVVADVTGVSAQMWTEDMSNGARSNSNSSASNDAERNQCARLFKLRAELDATRQLWNAPKGEPVHRDKRGTCPLINSHV